MISFIFELTRRDFSERFAGSVIGAGWAFIWPIVQLFIYIIIFGKLMGGRLPGINQVYAYGIYAASGLIPWTSFCNVVSRSTSIFLEKKYIISKVKVSLPSFPLFIVLAETVVFIFSICILLAVLIITNQKPSLRMILLLPFVYYIQQLFAFSLGLFFGTFTIFLKDLKQVVDIGLQLWFWFTPIVYIESILPQWVQKIIHLNPMYVFVDTYHKIFLINESLNFHSLIIMNFIAHAFLFVSVSFLKLLEKDVRDFL